MKILVSTIRINVASNSHKKNLQLNVFLIYLTCNIKEDFGQNINLSWLLTEHATTVHDY